jgi:heme oxygenase
MNILLDLKQSTELQHDALESCLDLLREDFTLEDYKNVLMGFYGFYFPLERIIDIPASRIKIPTIKKDLKNFGITDFDQLKICTDLPISKTLSHEWGVRYVLEGSTLGGLVLIKHFKEKFNISESNGAAYFSGYGEATFEMWKIFQSELLNFSESKSFQRAHVIEGACTTFQSLHSWLIPLK